MVKGSPCSLLMIMTMASATAAAASASASSAAPASAGKQQSQRQERKRKLLDHETNRDGHPVEDDAKRHHHHRHQPQHQQAQQQHQHGDAKDKDGDDIVAASAEYLAAPFTPSASTTNTPDINSNNNKRPSWVPTKEVFPWSATTATYGHCTNVSSRYTKVCRIGEGTYGVVYLAQDKTTDEQVALKRCLPHHEASDGFPITTLREIAILKELASAGGEKHGIISLKDVTVSSSRSGVFLVFEYAQHDLASLIDHHYTQHKCSPFTHSEVKRLMLQLLEALRFLHSNYVLHRDLKLSNLLYNQKGELKVADFGLARRVGGEYIVGSSGGKRRDKIMGSSNGTKQSTDPSPPSCCLTPKVVSLWYRPPELLLGAEYYDQGVDLWGAGCIMGELLRGKPIMDGKNELDQLQKMFEFLGPPNSDDWPGLMELPLLRRGEVEIPKRWHMGKNADKHLLDIFRDWKDPPGIKLLMGLLKYNPAARLTSEEALASDYFSTLPAPTPLRLMPTFPTKHNK